MNPPPVFPERLYLLHLGTGIIPRLGKPPLRLSLGSYLIQMSDGQHILIDSGLPPGEVPAYMKEIENPRTVLDHLDALSLTPGDINTVICTHFDSDHVGHNDAFPDAEFVAQREQYELAHTSDEPRFASARHIWDQPAFRFRLIEGDVEIVPGVTLLKTSGHTPGHQSGLVRLPNTGLVLLAVDAVMFESLFTPDRTAGGGDDDEVALRDSTVKLLHLVEREGVALVVFGHEGTQWDALKTAPAYYG